MNLFALLLCLLPLEPQDDALCSTCDAIEVNCYGPENRQQVIFWDLTPTGAMAVGWKFVDTSDVRFRGDSAFWFDGRRRFVSAPIWYETWTSYDPENFDRLVHPAERRRRLKALK